ncbi:uncharacterized protein [Anabrus simplex]|uniref:uncharacterized protein isoform X1 n=1 Tax=Anabrus simplex TaxID=316456 RepID=UPI0034DCD061
MPGVLLQGVLVLVCVVFAVADHVVEHSVQGEEAYWAALSLTSNMESRPPGCANCTRSERMYCMSTAVLHDHCCCDSSYYEAFPYIPHTCYYGPEVCEVLAGDCAHYARLRTCCCDSLLRAQWGAAGCLGVSWLALALCLLGAYLLRVV